ncbi:negative regulation of gluconeogenesis [Calycina marina]|uniref:Negative regulation of gluconeogenesis n=1 Tax=Calycina marina TaxID=1763456 RepID=A0A9P7Z9X2_9HELO|nr:negative regulation of gluconeogenesis [Calycina marina]
MADHITSKLDPANHLILDQSLIRLPFELLRKNFKSAHLQIEKDTFAVKTTLKDTAKASLNTNATPDEVLRNVDTMIEKMRGLKRKLNTLADEENRLHEQTQSRIRHLNELYEMKSLDDVKYEAWSRTRLDRLLVDHLLRHGYKESATALAREKDIEQLVDVYTFVKMGNIRQSLLNGSVVEALAWCNDNRKELKKAGSNLEFMLRTQQYIELLRMESIPKSVEAIVHARRHLLPYRDTYPKEVVQLCGLLAYPPGATMATAYPELYSQSRWTTLADLFMQTHNNLLGLPSVPLLHVALSAGLSALKTPACHSAHTSSISPTSASSITTSVCPICSTELNELARNVPYANHTTSHVESDLLLLPNGCVYGRERLEEYRRKAGLPAHEVKDLRSGKVYDLEDAKKVYIS